MTESKMTAQELRVEIAKVLPPHSLKPRCHWALDELEHRARLAHEMLPVIKQLVRAVEAFRDQRTRGIASPSENPFYAPTTQEGIVLARAIAAAAPFLDQED